MTDKTKSAEPDPPRDYGNGATWAADGPFYVPAELRRYYATAEPSDQLKAGYVTYGASVVDDIPREVVRLVSPGRDDGEPVTTAEVQTVPTLVDIAGAAGYPRWLHVHRLNIAEHARRIDEARRVTESHWFRCAVCGIRSGAVREVQVIDPTRTVPDLNVTGCPSCLPVLQETGRAALAARAADRRLDDGRRVGDVAAEVVAETLAARDGAA